MQDYSLEDDDLQDNSSQDEWVQFARYTYECNLQDDSLEDIDIDTVCKSIRRGSLSLDGI